MALIVVALYAAGEKQIFYKQQRVGYQNRIFWIYKFCTMYDVYDEAGELLPEEQRYSRLGRFLRKNSLNELPQLWNILRGDMSFVGPRPLLPEYLPLYNQRQALRHSVMGGLTGWAQVNGRNTLEWKKRLELDAYYAENASFGFDVYILFRTAWMILFKRNGDVPAEKFRGNDEK